MNLKDYIEAEHETPFYKKLLLPIIFVFILWGLWYTFFSDSNYQHEIYMDLDKLTLTRIEKLEHKDQYTFTYGQDFFVFFKKGWNTPEEITIKIYYHKNQAPALVLKQSRKFRKEALKMQMYFDEFFFDQAGKYEIQFLDEKQELLCSQKFHLLENK
ncbi:MAG: hypothetical protein AAF518_21335 [Spirochaetota bacterium]